MIKGSSSQDKQKQIEQSLKLRSKSAFAPAEDINQKKDLRLVLRNAENQITEFKLNQKSQQNSVKYIRLSKAKLFETIEELYPKCSRQQALNHDQAIKKNPINKIKAFNTLRDLFDDDQISETDNVKKMKTLSSSSSSDNKSEMDELRQQKNFFKREHETQHKGVLFTQPIIKKQSVSFNKNQKMPSKQLKNLIPTLLRQQSVVMHPTSSLIKNQDIDKIDPTFYNRMDLYIKRELQKTHSKSFYLHSNTKSRPNYAIAPHPKRSIKDQLQFVDGVPKKFSYYSFYKTWKPDLQMFTRQNFLHHRSQSQYKFEPKRYTCSLSKIESAKTHLRSISLHL